MTDDVIVNKLQSLDRCLKRIEEESEGDVWLNDFTKQDSIILNLQRACELSIDLASYVVKKKNLGLPQSSRECFVMLAGDHVLDESLSEELQKMIGFRNIAVHDYQKLNLEIVQKIIKDHLLCFTRFSQQIVQA